MELRCKEGDVAIVEYDDPPCIANVGQVVKVLGSLAVDLRGLHTWLIEPISTDHWYVCNWPSVTKAHVVRVDGNWHRHFIEHADKFLRPIRDTGFDSLEAIRQAHLDRKRSTEGDLPPQRDLVKEGEGQS